MLILEGLPFTVTLAYDVLESDQAGGAVHARQRFPRALGQRYFRLEARNLEVTTEVAAAIIAIDACKGAALPITLTIPDVGSVEVRFDDDGYSYEVANGTLRHMAITLVEEPRV